MFKLSTSVENSTRVYRVYFRASGTAIWKLWYKTDREEDANRFIKERMRLMREDSGEIELTKEQVGI